MKRQEQQRAAKMGKALTTALFDAFQNFPDTDFPAHLTTVALRSIAEALDHHGDATVRELVAGIRAELAMDKA